MNQAEICPKNQFKDNYYITTDDTYGEGCFGQIYPCKKINNIDNTIYCVKVIPINIDRERNIENEKLIKNTIAQLKLNQNQDTNLVQIQDIYFNSYALYIVMERCEEDLSIEFERLITENSWYTEEEVFDLIQQILRGFRNLNTQKIRHQDIKPENILIKYEQKGEFNERKIYKITDYGISILIENLTQKYDVIRTGSPNYTAPQVFENDVMLSDKSDIYSFGILFYQICYKAKLPYDCSSMQSRYLSLQQLKNNTFKAPPLDYKRGNKLQHLIESMIVYKENNRISYADLFNHAIIKSKGLEDTDIIQIESRNLRSSRLFDKSINLENKKKAQILQRLQRLQLLLESFHDKFKICQQLIEQMDDNDDFLFFKLNIYLIANYQLLYALAFIYIRPQELHPNILKYNDQLLLIEKLREAQTGIKTYQQDTQIYKTLNDSIQSEYHKFAKQFRRFTIDLSERKGLPKELINFCDQAIFRRFEQTILLENIKNLQQKYLNRIPNQLQQLIDQVIKFGSLSPVTLYQKDINSQSQDSQFLPSQQIGSI